MNKYQEAFNDIVNNGISVDYFNQQTDKKDNENTILIIQELVDKETGIKSLEEIYEDNPKEFLVLVMRMIKHIDFDTLKLSRIDYIIDKE